MLAGEGLVPPEYLDFVAADVVGRHVFYNRSAFDGHDAAIGAADDGAVATDKQALLPGQQATFANYTSYSRGLNGLMIDIAGLPGAPTAADFSFALAVDPAGTNWLPAPAPQAVAVRRGAGALGADRITIAWADGEIQNAWLRVIVQATTRTGLPAPDVFYFGNAVGETGNAAGDAVVDALDRQATVDHPRDLGNPAPLAFAYDFNRDRLVDAADVAIVEAHFTAPGAALPLVTGAAPPGGPADHRPASDVYQWGDGGYPVYFGPTTVRTAAGSVLVFAEGRGTALDSSSYAIVVRRSTDGGATFSEPYTIHREPFINSGAPLVDQQTGTIYFIYTLQVDRVLVQQSDDDGRSWSAPRDITAAVKVAGPDSPPGHAFPATPWRWYAIGPGHGIQLQHGPWAGRLIVGADHRYIADAFGPSWSHVIYSDDHGQSWRLGGGFSELGAAANTNTNEATLVERANGDLYLSMRIVREGGRTRAYARSSDGGLSWSDAQQEPAFTVPSVAGTTLRLNDGVVLFLCSDSDINLRRKLTVWASYDDTLTWVKRRTIDYAFAGYQDATLVGPDTVLVAFGRGHVADKSASFAKIGLARFNLRWLESDRPDEFDWYFNERAPGQTAETAGPAIADYSPWDNRAQARGEAPPRYVAGAAGAAALALTAGESVRLAPAGSEALQFAAGQSFTVQLVLATTAADGVVVGSLPGVRHWTLRLAAGKPVFSVDDLATSATVVGDAAINDGQWHHLALVRDAGQKQLRLYVDRTLAAAPVTDATGSLRSDQEVTLGQYSDGTEQLELTVDSLRVTRGVVPAAEFLRPDDPNPLPWPAPTYSDINPTTIAGLRLWLPAYDPSRYFADAGFADPLRLVPTPGDGIRSAIDASGAAWHLATTNFVGYEYDGILGPHVRHAPVADGQAATWRIRGANGTQADNFDFIQNTGTFTVSLFVKADALPIPMGSYSILMDNNEATGTGAGTFLALLADGRAQLSVSDGSVRRANAYSGAATLLPGRWYHVAAVGQGPGNPVTMYVTPYTGTPAAVQAVDSSATLVGPNGQYPTDADHDLTFAGRSRFADRAFRGSLANQAIYDRALSPAEIQQLFDFGTAYVAPALLQPTVTPTAVLEDCFSTDGLVVLRHPDSGREVSHYKIDQIAGGSLYLADGTTAVHNGDFITVQQGYAGLRFRPTPDSVAPGAFRAWPAKANYDQAVGGEPALGQATVTPVNDPPTFRAGDDQTVGGDSGPQIIANWAAGISAGPADEAGQALWFETSTDNDGLFALGPQISADGTLTYATAPGASGAALVTVVLRDAGGTAHGGSDESTQTFRIQVVPNVFVAGVRTTADDGPGSLRQAMLDVQAAPGRPHRIVFAIPGAGPHVVVPQSPLPPLAEAAELYVAAGAEVDIGAGGPWGVPLFASVVKTGGGTLEFGGGAGLVTGHELHVARGVVRLAAGSGTTALFDALAIDASAALDLTDNTLVVRAGPVERDRVHDQLAALVGAGFAAFAWNGPGIRSSTAAADSSGNTGVGVMLNDNGLGRPFFPVLAGQSLDANCVLVRYAYYGDADLSGAIDGTDYALIDNGFRVQLSGWFNGDFDYSGIIDGTDYVLIDNVFYSQGRPLATAVPPGAGPVPRAAGTAPPAGPEEPSRLAPASTPPSAALDDWHPLPVDDGLLELLLAGTHRARRRPGPRESFCDCAGP